MRGVPHGCYCEQEKEETCYSSVITSDKRNKKCNATNHGVQGEDMDSTCCIHDVSSGIHSLGSRIGCRGMVRRIAQK